MAVPAAAAQAVGFIGGGIVDAFLPPSDPTSIIKYDDGTTRVALGGGPSTGDLAALPTVLAPGSRVLPLGPRAGPTTVRGPKPVTETPARVSGDALAATRKEFAAVRPEFWKNQARTNAAGYSPENLARMTQGKPPIGADGFPMELHHRIPLARGGTNAFENLIPLSRTDHRMGLN